MSAARFYTSNILTISMRQQSSEQGIYCPFHTNLKSNASMTFGVNSNSTFQHASTIDLPRSSINCPSARNVVPQPWGRILFPEKSQFLCFTQIWMRDLQDCIGHPSFLAVLTTGLSSLTVFKLVYTDFLNSSFMLKSILKSVLLVSVWLFTSTLFWMLPQQKLVIGLTSSTLSWNIVELLRGPKFSYTFTRPWPSKASGTKTYSLLVFHVWARISHISLQMTLIYKHTTD